MAARSVLNSRCGILELDFLLIVLPVELASGWWGEFWVDEVSFLVLHFVLLVLGHSFWVYFVLQLAFTHLIWCRICLTVFGWHHLLF